MPEAGQLGECAGVKFYHHQAHYQMKIQFISDNHNENKIHSLQTFDEMLHNTMEERFCNLEFAHRTVGHYCPMLNNMQYSDYLI